MIEIEVSNAIKEKVYREDLPDFQDRLQTFHFAALGRLHGVLQTAVALQAAHLDKLKASVEQTTQTIAAVDLAKDLDVFVAGNRRVGGWTEPEGWSWEPAEGFYEVGTWSTDGAAKVVLQNRASPPSPVLAPRAHPEGSPPSPLASSAAGLAKSAAKLDQVTPILEIKHSELASLTSLLTSASLPASAPTAGDPDSLSDSLLPLLPEVLTLSSQASASNVTLSRLADALGEETGEGRAHDFKSASFTVPTKCRVCEGSIWGLTKQGKSCRNCGVVVHSKCELKVRAPSARLPWRCSSGETDAACASQIPGNCARAASSASVSRRHSTSSSLSRGPSSASTTSLGRSSSTASSRAPPAVPGSSGLAHENSVEEESEDENEDEGGRQIGVLFDYQQTSEFELSVSGACAPPRDLSPPVRRLTPRDLPLAQRARQCSCSRRTTARAGSRWPTCRARAGWFRRRTCRHPRTRRQHRQPRRKQEQSSVRLSPRPSRRLAALKADAPSSHPRCQSRRSTTTPPKGRTSCR